MSGPAGAGIEIYRDVFGDDPATWADASPQSHVAPGKGIPPFLPRRARDPRSPARRRDVRASTSATPASP